MGNPWKTWKKGMVWSNYSLLVTTQATTCSLKLLHAGVYLLDHIYNCGTDSIVQNTITIVMVGEQFDAEILHRYQMKVVDRSSKTRRSALYYSMTILMLFIMLYSHKSRFDVILLLVCWLRWTLWSFRGDKHSAAIP